MLAYLFQWLLWKLQKVIYANKNLYVLENFDIDSVLTLMNLN